MENLSIVVSVASMQCTRLTPSGDVEKLELFHIFAFI